jgi:hypothetical protein
MQCVGVMTEADEASPWTIETWGFGDPVFEGEIDPQIENSNRIGTHQIDPITCSGDPFEDFDDDDFDDEFDDDFEEEWDEELPGDADQFEPDEVEIDEDADAEPIEPEFEDEE